MFTTISFIGAGKVSSALGVYFISKGFEINGYYSRSFKSAKYAAEFTNSTAFSELATLLGESNMIWITTPDDQIEEVVKQILSFSVPDVNLKTILHASGVHSLDVLEPLARGGYNIAAAHPLMAFNDPASAAKRMPGVWFAIEDAPQSVMSLEKFFDKCGNHTFRLETGSKTLYHAAACMLSNYMVTLLDASYRMFEHVGLNEEETQAATTPLLESVIENLKDKSTAEALTGPIKRLDRETVNMHLASLTDEMPEMLQLYKLLGKQTMQMIEDYKLKDILD